MPNKAHADALVSNGVLRRFFIVNLKAEHSLQELLERGVGGGRLFRRVRQG
jgi:hypothetical protein